MVAITSSSSSANGSHEDSPLIYSQNEFGSSIEFSRQRKTSRKQWSVQGEPRSLLRRLRSQLAEDGCPESQFQMAKTLLEHTEDVNYVENCHQAVFWLTQASLQGCIDATNLLKRCLEEGTGICEQNYQDVKRCLEMDHQEKLGAVAGKHLFNSLSEGNEFVTQKKLESKISEIINSKMEENEKASENGMTNMSKKEIKIYLEEKYGSRRLSEAALVGSSLEFIRGEIPSIRLSGLRLGNDQPTFWSKFIVFHEFMLNIVEDNMVKKFSVVGNVSRSCYLVILTSVLYILYHCSLSRMYTIAFVSVWFLSFFIMCYSALALMIRHKNRNLFYVWGRVFHDFNPELDLDIATKRYKNKCIQYYIALFGCMVTYLIMLPVIDTWMKVLTTPPLFIVSFCLMTSSFHSNFSFYMLCSLFYFLAHYTDGQSYLKNSLFNLAPSLKPFILEESINIYDILHLNLEIGSVFHSLWIVSLAFVSLTIGASGILFHALCVFWFHLTFIIATSEQFGCWTCISFVIWSIAFFLPKGFHFFSILTPAFLCSLSCYTSGLGYVITISVFGVVYLFLYTLCKLNSRLASTLKMVFLGLSLVFIFQQPLDSRSKISSLKWDQYQNVCLPTKESIEAHTVHSCSSFKGLAVEWQAIIKQIEVESVLNIPETILSVFPPVLQQHLKCSFTNPKPSCEEMSSEKDYQRCLLLQEVKGADCSLNQWNEYKFRFIVIMDTTFWKFAKHSEVILSAGNDFADAVFNLSVHDKISFVGTLDDGIGTSMPQITLSSLSCVDCKSKLQQSDPTKVKIDYEKLSESLKSAFNFIFGPTLTV